MLGKGVVGLGLELQSKGRKHDLVRIKVLGFVLGGPFTQDNRQYIVEYFLSGSNNKW